MRIPAHDRGELRWRDAGQIGVHQRRFSDPRGARDDYQALASGKPCRQDVQNRTMTRTQKEKVGVRSALEGSAFEMIKVEIHTHSPQRAAWSCSRQPEILHTCPKTPGHALCAGSQLLSLERVLS